MKNKKFNEKEFKKRFNEIFSIIKPGLEEGKRLYEDGLMNLSLEQLKWLFDNRKKDGSMIVFLTIVIQAYPGNKWEFEEGEDHRLCNVFIELIMTAIMEKNGLVRCHTSSNKISDDFDLEAREDVYEEFLKGVVNVS